MNHSGGRILTMWHSRFFYPLYYFRNRRDFHILVSPSADGDLLANVASLLGYSVARGSTYKKAVSSARTLIKMLRENKIIVIIADGSRGPRQKAQPGSIQIAGITGARIVPMGCNAKNRIEFNSWDRFHLPLPFTRCVLDFGPPIEVPPKAGEEILSEKEAELENELNRLIGEI